MANFIIKSDERKAFERKVLNDFTPHNTRENQEYAEYIAAKAQEILKKGAR